MQRKIESLFHPGDSVWFKYITFILSALAYLERGDANTNGAVHQSSMLKREKNSEFLLWQNLRYNI